MSGDCVASTDGGVTDGGRSLRDAGDAAPGPDGALVGLGCSADLRDVLAANGAVLGTCGDDQGCFEGQCIEACDAAGASGGSLGCRFQVTTPPSYPFAEPPCLAVFVTNAWSRTVRLRVQRGDTTFDVTQFARVPDATRAPAEWASLPASGLPVDEVVVLFLTSSPTAVQEETGDALTCPVTPAVDGATEVSASGLGESFRITTDAPVAVYDVLPFGGASSYFPSAQLLLPTSAWGTDYLALGPPVGSAGEIAGPLWLQVAASVDGTRVQIRPSLMFPGAGMVPTIAAGETGTLMLDAGEYVQFEVGGDLSGTAVRADQPVALMVGNRFLRLQDTSGPGGDATHQQLLPLDALGHEYVAAPYATRRADLADEVIAYRLLGAVDGTTLTYDPPLPGAPTAVEAGEAIELAFAGPRRIASQDPEHPVALAQLMTTANLEGGSRPGATGAVGTFEARLGDEEHVIMWPPAQFLTRYVFFTDPTYATTNLVLTRVGNEGVFAPVTIDCIGEVEGWRDVGSGARYQVAEVDLVRADEPVGECANGRHIAESIAPFGLVVWGLDTYASYAYPAGGNAATLTELAPPF